jgi:hypothetical protein
MSFKLIDYSEHYFLKLAGEPMPESREGKFVQIRHGDKEYFVLSPSKLSKYHANIVERFCELNGINGYWNSGKTSYNIVDNSWSVVGGGRWVMNSNNKTLDLGSSSQAYGRFDSTSLKIKILSLKAMQGYIVNIGD